jgi:arabinogalactan endo-1,4-beta-galactosidase
MNMNSIFAFIFILTIGCNRPSDSNDSNRISTRANNDFAKGADISWLTQMEASGIKFYDPSGKQKDCIRILKDLGMNSIRLRVWVDPTSGWCNTADVVVKAVRAKTLGMKVLIDFHYSDWWADPGKQNKPAAWANQDFALLKQSMADHTTSVLKALKVNGVTPEWVQIGNETNDGMLWPDGRASNSMNNFAQLINSGYNAVKAVDTSIKVIVHISNGFDNNLFRWIFDGLKNNGAQFDTIGMSLYPSTSNWSSLNDQCLTNMNDMVSRYNKDVMIVEVGMSWDQPDICNLFITDLIRKVKSVTGGRGLGVFYWEPECYNHWQGYTLGAFDNNGKPTKALSAFR